jgi:uncharacterized membrane protein YphA (DoxX/SURF4 family)
MASTAVPPTTSGQALARDERAVARADWHDPRYQAFAIMRLAFTVAPIAFGLDKFFNVMVDWPTYLAPWINDIAPGSGQQFMYVVGAIEILAGVIVALKPRYGAYVVAAWLAGIIFNLLTYSGYYDIALRDFGLMLGALTLARLASVYDAPLTRASAVASAREISSRPAGLRERQAITPSGRTSVAPPADRP